jgi:hypothetical protein
MTIAQEYRKLLITEYLAPCLKRHGYKKKNYLFFKQHPDVVKLISIQNSSMTIPETCNFTINLGLYFPEVAQHYPAALIPGQAPDSGIPRRAELGQVDIRIGHLIPNDYRDRWWLLLPDSDWKAVAEEVTAAVETYGLPWVNNFASPSAAKSHVVASRNYRLAAMFALAEGNIDEARGYFETTISEERPIHQIWLDWAKVNGLLN